MSDFQLIKEDEHAFTVKHPSGKHFQVAKAGLDKKVIAKIKAMGPVKMADGGVVPDSASDPLQAIIGSSFFPGEKPAANQGDPADPNLKDLNGNPPIRYTGHGRTDEQIIADQNNAIMANRSPASFIGDAAHAIGSGIHDVYNAWSQNVTQPIVNGVKDVASGLVSGVSGNPMPSAQAATAPNPNALNALTDSQAQAAAERQALSGANGGPSPASTAPTAQPQGVQLPKDMQSAYGMQMAGIKGNANAAMQAGDQSKQAYDAYAEQVQQHEQMYQERLKYIDEEQQKLMDSFASNKIDPNRVWKNASTGNKIMAGLGLFLSGMGSGITGQQNGALTLLQKKMDQDIEAQKANKDGDRSLFQMNMEKYKNAQMAEEATRLQMNTSLNAQLESIKASTGSLQAKSNAQILQGQLQMQMAQQKHQLAMMQMQAGVYGGGNGQGGVQIGKEPPALLLDDKYRAKRVPIGGVAYQAPNEKTADEMRKMEGAYQPIVDDIKLLQNLGKGAAIPGSSENQRAQAAMGRIAMKVNEFNGYNRFTDMDEKTIHNQFNDPSSIKSFFQGQGATYDTLRALKNSLENARSKNLIGYKGPANFQGTYVGNVNGR
jgi:hypothetical protein